MELNKKQILKQLKEYSEYHRFSNNCKIDINHLKDIKYFVNNNIENISNCTWYDMAGGFMLFCLELQGSTYCIGNDDFDGINDTIIYYGLSLKAYNELLEIGYDMGLLLHEEVKLNNES